MPQIEVARFKRVVLQTGLARSSAPEQFAEVEGGAGRRDQAAVAAVQEPGAAQFADRPFDSVAGAEAPPIAAYPPPSQPLVAEMGGRTGAV